MNNAFEAVREQAVKDNGDYLPTVRVSTRQVDGVVEIRVCDNGPGIPPDIHDKIFEPFFTTMPTGSGTGLGLSLAYDIVTQGHGGTLAVERAKPAPAEAGDEGMGPCLRRDDLLKKQTLHQHIEEHYQIRR